MVRPRSHGISAVRSELRHAVALFRSSIHILRHALYIIQVQHVEHGCARLLRVCVCPKKSYILTSSGASILLVRCK